LNGKLDFLDGMVFPDICEEVRCLADIWRANCPAAFHFSLTVPVNLTSPLAREFLISQFERFKASLEAFVGHAISDADLKRSIHIYNRNRQLLARLYDIRRDNPGLFRGSDFVTAVAASMLMPKEEHSEHMVSLLKQVEGAMHPGEGRAKIVLSGYLCDMPELDVVDLVPELGGVIVDDDLYVGSRHFSKKVDEALPPIEALADKFIDDVPCATKYSTSKDWGDYLVTLARKSRADGVVILMGKFCGPHGFDYPLLKERLSAAGIPHLLLTAEHAGASGQIRTRLQAFIELVGTR